jgi:hypothetical protein
MPFFKFSWDLWAEDWRVAKMKQIVSIKITD